MCDVTTSTTEEKIDAREGFFTLFFPKWKSKFCQDMGKRDPVFLEWKDNIIWRTDKDGTMYSPAHLSRLYFFHYRPRAGRLMKDRSKLLDRHKIVALTQQMILEHYPMAYSLSPTFSYVEEFPTRDLRLLNVSFAYYFALEFLATWNKERYDRRKIHFDADLLFKHLEATDFPKEHHKYLSLELYESFPTFLISQLWFSLEQWGLEYMRNRNPV